MNMIKNPLLRDALNTMIHNMNDIVIITDRPGNIVWASNGFLKLSEYTWGEIIGKKPGDLLQGPDTDKETVKRLGEAIKEGKFIKEDILNYTKNKTKYWLRLSIFPVYNDNRELVGFVAIEFDLTDQYDQNDKLKKLTEKLEKEINTKSRIMSILSHDIIDMINTSSGITELLMMTEIVDEEFKAYLKVLHDSSKGVYNLLTNLVKSYDTEYVNHERINVMEVVEKSINHFENKIELKNINIYNEVDKDLIIIGNYIYVLTILNNILSNAIKFTHAYGSVTIRTKVTNFTVEIIFIDNGVGIPKDKLGKLMNIYGKEIQTLGTDKEYGMGYGLLMVRDLINKNNGKINIESTENVGTTVTITLNKTTKNALTVQKSNLKLTEE